MRPRSSRAIPLFRERKGLGLMPSSPFAACSAAAPKFITLQSGMNTWNPAFHALGLKLAPADFVIHHFGHLCSPAELRTKDEFYRRLGRLKVQDSPNDPEAWVELGLQEYEQFRNYSAGIECFKKALALKPRYCSVPALSLANLYIDIHAEERALELLAGVVMTGRAAGEKERTCGDAFYNLGRLKEARASYLRALAILSEDARIGSKLGLTEVRLGLKKNGLARLARALQANADEWEMHDRMIKGCILANLMPEAAAAAERLAIEHPNPASILRAAAIRAQMKEWRASRRRYYSRPATVSAESGATPS